MRSVTRWLVMGVALAGLLLAVSYVASSRGQEPAERPVPVGEPIPAASDPVPEDAVEVETRGPIHEAFASPSERDRANGLRVEKRPPLPIEELPPEAKPEGENVVWIPGYYAWDDERQDYLWISGMWRDAPPGRVWVAGYWGEAENGWSWIPGFWASAEQSEVEYLPTPPESLDVGPTITQPSANHFWSPGCWVYRETRYMWRPGYWAISQPNWVWTPPRYNWCPTGWIFVPGFWDYPPIDRGCLFTPVYFRQVAFQRPFFYQPRFIVNISIIQTHLFCRPRYGHYYFGDYYAERYGGFGIQPWFNFATGSRIAYDPLIAYNRWNYSRGNANWLVDVRQRYDYFARTPGVRPPRTYLEQTQIVSAGRGANVAQIQNSIIAAPLSQVINNTTINNTVVNNNNTVINNTEIRNRERRGTVVDLGGQVGSVAFNPRKFQTVGADLRQQYVREAKATREVATIRRAAELGEQGVVDGKLQVPEGRPEGAGPGRERGPGTPRAGGRRSLQLPDSLVKSETFRRARERATSEAVPGLPAANGATADRGPSAAGPAAGPNPATTVREDRPGRGRDVPRDGARAEGASGSAATVPGVAPGSQQPGPVAGGPEQNGQDAPGAGGRRRERPGIARDTARDGAGASALPGPRFPDAGANTAVPGQTGGPPDGTTDRGKEPRSNDPATGAAGEVGRPGEAGRPSRREIERPRPPGSSSARGDRESATGGGSPRRASGPGNAPGTVDSPTGERPALPPGVGSGPDRRTPSSIERERQRPSRVETGRPTRTESPGSRLGTGRSPRSPALPPELGAPGNVPVPGVREGLPRDLRPAPTTTEANGDRGTSRFEAGPSDGGVLPRGAAGAGVEEGPRPRAISPRGPESDVGPRGNAAPRSRGRDAVERGGASAVERGRGSGRSPDQGFTPQPPGAVDPRRRAPGSGDAPSLPRPTIDRTRSLPSPFERPSGAIERRPQSGPVPGVGSGAGGSNPFGRGPAAGIRSPFERPAPAREAQIERARPAPRVEVERARPAPRVEVERPSPPSRGGGNPAAQFGGPGRRGGSEGGAPGPGGRSPRERNRDKEK